MPNRDKTGPRGEGPRTGRQEGNCENEKPVKRGLRGGFRKRFFKGNQKI